jgi:2-dehydro-3-deoxygluconokinase
MVHVDLMKEPFDKGPYAMALRPYDFAVKYKLLLDETNVNSLDKIRAEKLFQSQLGKLWTSFDKLKKLLPMIDVLSVGILDIRAIFQDDSISDLEDAYRRLLSKYPNLKMLFSTNRETISAEEYRLQGSVYTQGKLYQSPKQAIYQVVDRIGTGDSYASGVIHGLLKGETPQNIVDFATANAILKHTVYGDVAIFTESQVKAYMASLPGVINR